MPYNDRLFDLLNALDDKELQTLWTEALGRKPDDEDYGAGSRDWRVACISKEWRMVHGHTLVNPLRSPHELAWKRILIDVADKLHSGWRWTPYRLDDDHTEQEIEAAILRIYDERMQQFWDKMSAQDKEKLASTLNLQLAADAMAMNRAGQAISLRTITVASLGSGISAGLLTGAGALMLAQGAASAMVGGLLGGVLSQLGLWLVVQMFGFWSGVHLVVAGGTAAAGSLLIAAPAAVFFAANAVMGTSYRKTVPATLMLLTAHELRRQLATLED